MSRKRSLFERITGTVNLGRDSYERIDIDVQERETYYNDKIESDPFRANQERYASPLAPNNWMQEEVEEKAGELSVDMYELDDEVVIQAMIAGVRPDDLDISLTREMVTIEGHREGPQGIPDRNYYNRELFWGTFSRTIVLPAEIEVEEATANEVNGLLILKLPKLDKARSTKLKVRSSN